ncbi:hypothetical protein [Microbacterium sp. A84]|uniref:hypothetical protein n=1 Tax=Microbacterium sp. A84 TaxID=3450715 RepID=UPI003F432796
MTSESQPKLAFKSHKEVRALIRPTLRKQVGRPARFAAAAVITHGLELGIHPSSIAHYLQREPHGVAGDLHDLAHNGGLWATLARSMKATRKHSHDPIRSATKSVAWMLAEPSPDVTAYAHRNNIQALAAITLATVREAATFGDAIYVPADDLAVDMGCARSTAQNRIISLAAADVVDRRSTGNGQTQKIKVKRAKGTDWERTQTVEAQQRIRDIVAGNRTLLNVFVHPGLAYGTALLPTDVYVLLLGTHGIDPRARGFEDRTLGRARARLRTAEVTDTRSLFAALERIAATPDAPFKTPLDLRAEAARVRQAQIDERTAEINELRLASKAAWPLDHDNARVHSVVARDSVNDVLEMHGRLFELRGEELRAWVTTVRSDLAPRLQHPATVAGAAAIHTAHMSVADRSPQAVEHLAQDMTTKETNA